MPRSIPALVEPTLLIWARERAGFTLQDASVKADVEVEQLQQWESGVARPSIPQLRKLGEVYKRPLAVFFLAEPPKGFDPQREFRRLPGLTPQKETPEMRLALRIALFRREAARDLYERLGDEIPECRVVAHPGEDEELVAQRIRGLLGIDWKTQLNWPAQPPHYHALNVWRTAVEQQGILVFQTGDVELKEMRGTSIPHGPLPVILLNNADAPVGRVFTLIHELAHILLTNGGHRTSAMEGQQLPEDQRLERASNRFAAATLMPKRDFLAEAARFPSCGSGDDEALKALANRIKVSPEAALRRLVSLNKASASLYREKRRLWQQHPWFKPPQGAGGPPIEVKIASTIGKPFLSLVLDGYRRNVVSSADVSDFLGVQLKYLERVARQLLPGPGEPALS